MAKGIVHLFEVIKIDKEQSALLFTALAAVEVTGQLFKKIVAVG
nr:hypothetical protein [Aliidiomarina sp.]